MCVSCKLCPLHCIPLTGHKLTAAAALALANLICLLLLLFGADSGHCCHSLVLAACLVCLDHCSLAGHIQILVHFSLSLSLSPFPLLILIALNGSGCVLCSV